MSSISPMLKIIVSSIASIYVGAHGSLARPSSAAPPPPEYQIVNGEKIKTPRKREMPRGGLEPTDAIMMPLMAGLCLVGLYYLIQYLQDPDILNMIMRGYMCVMAVVSLTVAYSHGISFITSFAFPNYWQANGTIFAVDQATQRHYDVENRDPDYEGVEMPLGPFPVSRGFSFLPALPQLFIRELWDWRELYTRSWDVHLRIPKLVDESVPIRVPELLAVPLAIGTIASYYYTLNSMASNLLALGFCYTSFQYLSPTTFLTGTLVLTGLFFYDIFMVFYTPYMITVATKLDVPIKLSFSTGKQMNILGLGDIVVPGMLMGLALRFDLWKYYSSKPKRVVPAMPEEGVEKEEMVDEQKREKVTDGEGLQMDANNESNNGSTEEVTDNPKDDSKDASKETSSKKEKKPDVRPVYVDATGYWGDRVWTLFASKKQQIPELQAVSFPKPYFTASLIGYLAGMTATTIVLVITRHGQPALLYLVPGVVGSIWLQAWRRGEIQEVRAYTEDGSLEPEGKDKKHPAPHQLLFHKEPGVSFFKALLTGQFHTKKPTDSEKEADKGKEKEAKEKEKANTKEEGPRTNPNFHAAASLTLYALPIKSWKSRAAPENPNTSS